MGAKTAQWGKNSLFSKWCWDNEMSLCQRMKPDSYLIPRTKVNSTGSENLDVKAETRTLLEGNTGVNLCGLGFAHSYFESKDTVKKVKRRPTKSGGKCI